MALGLSLPRTLFAHGWWTVDGEKMSKSRGNVVDPNAMAGEFGADAFRYFLLREVPFGQDGDFSRKALMIRYNSELANDLGNLYSRTLSMIERYAGGRIPKPNARVQKADDRVLTASARALDRTVVREMDRFAFHRALREIWTLVDRANRYVDQNAPWELAKDSRKTARLETVLYNLAETLRILSVQLYPFIPDTARRMAAGLGWTTPMDRVTMPRDNGWGKLKSGGTIQKGRALFPRMETEPSPPKPEPGSQKTRPKEMPMESTGIEPSTISIDEFRKLDLRVGRIMTAEKVAGADKLLKLGVDIGTEIRQVVAGIATRYAPDAILGRPVILVANLKPAVIRGIESRGMILAAGEKEVEAMATFIEPIQPGSRVK
jgi:methionyl-tRNA synthetase